MPERAVSTLQMLLVEPETLLRRTVSLTARTLGMGSVHEASSVAVARRMLREQAFHGAVIAIDCTENPDLGFNLSLLDQVRDGMSASERDMPIAVMAEHATGELLRDLRQRDVRQVILKPFRAKVLIETFAAFEQAHNHK
ncbi:response regulator [Oxalobacteraceae bacterium]|nr:response regulator [Oxalobacteraceae bacterium]